MRAKDHQFDNFVVTGGTVSCHYENLPVTTKLSNWQYFVPCESCPYFLGLSTLTAVDPTSLNSLAPGKFEWNFRSLIFQIISVIDGWGISSEIGLRWMLLDLTDDKSTLVLLMAWCRQATSHYLSQCWPILLSTHGVTRFQWVNVKTPLSNKHKMINISCP